MNFFKKLWKKNDEKEQVRPDEYFDRLNKLNELKKTGFLYKSKFNKKQFTKDIRELDESSFRNAEEVMKSPKNSFSVAGRIITKRDHGGIIFFDIQDMKGELQVAFTKDVLKDQIEQAAMLDVGDFIGVSGEPFITKRKTLALLCNNYELLTKSLLPIPSSHFGLSDTETRYRKRYIDLIINKEVKNRFVVRSKCVESMRQFLLANDFIEVVTRTIQPTAGGAIAEKFVVHHNALNRDFNLRISNELDLKMVVAGGLERVFEFSIDFRNEGIDSSHLQEFQMLEWYFAYEDFKKGIEFSKQIIRKAMMDSINSTKCTIYTKDNQRKEIDFSKEIKEIEYGSLLKEYDIDVNAPINELEKVADSLGVKKENKSRSRGNLLDDIYKKKIRPNLIEPIFITHFPAEVLPLARRNDKDNTKTDSFQLVVGSWEIIKGYSELVDPIEQLKAFRQQAKEKRKGDKEAMDFNTEFLTAMEHGMPPITGWGMGIDRFVSLITGAKNIKESVLFPLLGEDE